jgi:hypothetical protein
MLEQRVDAQDLPRLEVQADPDGKPGVPLEALVDSRHGAEL